MVSIRVMSYNIQGHAASRRPDHVPKLAEVIAAAAPDVVGLQEVHCRTRASPIDQGEQIAQLTGLTLAFGRSCAMDGGAYGNAVLTRGTILGSEVFPLPGSGEQRSLLKTDISVRGAEFTFFVTHLAAWGRLLRVARLRQIAELGDRTARVTAPHILVGDFNVPPAAEEMRTLLSHGRLVSCGSPTDVTFSMTRQRLDYVFHDRQWECSHHEIIHRGPSDHWPIVVELGLKA